MGLLETIEWNRNREGIVNPDSLIDGNYYKVRIKHNGWVCARWDANNREFNVSGWSPLFLFEITELELIKFKGPIAES